MQINIETVYTTIIDIVKTYVGADLSTTVSGKPAVVRARGKSPEMNYPYITVDILDTGKFGPYLKVKELNEDGYLTYKRDVELPIQLRVYASDSASYTICRKLQYAFEYEAVHNYLYTTLEGVVGFVGDIKMVPDVLPTTQYESNYFIVTLRLQDEFVDLTSVPIENIEISSSYEQ